MVAVRLILLCLSITAFTCRSEAAVEECLEPLVTLMIQRLQLSREVAWSKCASGIPVADPTREAAMLRDLKEVGAAMGLTAGEVSRLFIPQIAASRRYQQELIAGWRSGIDVPRIAPLDLVAVLRPRLDKVNREMLRQWVVLCHEPLDWADREETERMIRKRGIPVDVARIAAGPLGGRSEGYR